MFKRILVPIDLSDRNTRTLEVVLALARQNRAHVTLCHVVQKVRDVSAAELREFYRRLESHLRLGRSRARHGDSRRATCRSTP